MRINHNLMAMNTQRQLSTNNNSVSKSLEKLSSGLRINRAGDDAAGLAISEKMRSQIRGLDQASANAQDGISLIQTAEGGLNEVHSILQRMRELAVQSANDTNVTADREEIQKEINALTSEINRIGNTTEFNTMKLLDGSQSSTSVVTSAKTVGAATQIFQPATTVGLTWTIAGASGTGNPVFTNGSKANEIGVATEDVDWSTLQSGSTLTITMVSGTSGMQLKVELHVTGLSGTAVVTAFSGVDLISADTLGGYSVDYHGISFQLSFEEASKMVDGDSLEVDLTASAKANNGYLANTINLAESWKTYADVTGVSGTAKATFTSDGIKVDSSNQDTIDARSIGFQISGGYATVTVYGAGGSGDVLYNDIYKVDGQTFSYDMHGISFTLENIRAGDTLILEDLTLKTTIVEKSVTEDNSLKLQTGANAGQAMVVDISDMRSLALGVSALQSQASKDIIDSNGNVMTAYYTQYTTVSRGTDNNNIEYALDVTDHTKAAAALQVIDDAIKNVSSERARLGANQNRLEYTINNLDTASENISSAESRIRDVDMAKEMMNFTSASILQQAAQAMLAQANQQPQGVLQLLR